MSLDVPSDMAVASDTRPATWVMDRLWPWPTPDGRVLAGSLVPEGFSAYAAIRYESRFEDELSDDEVQALVDVLSEFTGVADSCWFCLWTGYGGMDLRGAEQALIREPQREYVLLRGPVSAVLGFNNELPQIWWPENRSWCFGTDVDYARAFIGGNEELVAVLESEERLDVERIPLDVRVDETNHVERLLHP